MIKSDFWADEKIGKLSTNAKLLFIGMWNFCDDIGVVRANSAYLKSNIFPYNYDIDVCDISKFCIELEKIGLILTAKFNDESFFLVKNFSKHQRIDKPSKFRFVNDTDKHNVLELFISSSVSGVLQEYSRMKVKEKEKVKEKVKEKEADANASESFNFDAIYQEYPRKEGKMNGINKLKKIIKSQDQFNLVLEASKKYNRHCKDFKIETRYIKLFSTWVNGEHWNDVYERKITEQELADMFDAL